MKVGLHSALYDAHVDANQPSSQRQLSIAIGAITSGQVRNVPLNLCLVLDHSGSMNGRPLETVKKAAIQLIERLNPGDRISIVDIKESVKVLHPLDGNVEGARAAINATVARGGTGLYNGLYMTLKEMVKLRRDNGQVRRQAMLVLSDGDDTASLVNFDDVMEVAKQSGVAATHLGLRQPVALKHRFGS